jgi:hypothetical protein
MAPKAVVTLAKDRSAPAAKAVTGWWDRFQSLAEVRVQEGNLVAGERLWHIVKSPDVVQALIIQSTRHPADFVECSLDGQSRVLTCRQGSAIGSGVLSFQLPEAPLPAEGRCTVEQALGLILDQLVWLEDGDSLAASENES